MDKIKELNLNIKITIKLKKIANFWWLYFFSLNIFAFIKDNVNKIIMQYSKIFNFKLKNILSIYFSNINKKFKIIIFKIFILLFNLLIFFSLICMLLKHPLPNNKSLEWSIFASLWETFFSYLYKI